MNSINNIISKIDLFNLRGLVGLTILRALDNNERGTDSNAISDLLVMKFGNQILSNADIRRDIIYSFSEEEAKGLCNDLGLSGDAFLVLSTYFKAYSFAKSKILVEHLNLDDDYLLKVPIDDRETSELITTKFGEEIKSLGFPHPYQKKIKRKIAKRLNQKTEKYFFVQMPTGAGKTFTALESAVDLLRGDSINKKRDKRFVVWLVDSNELAEQSLQSFKKLWKQKGDREIKAFRFFKDFEPDFSNENEGFVFAGFAKVYGMLESSHRGHSNFMELINNTDLLIVDEAHHASAATYMPTINRFKKTPFEKIMGLSATPGRSDPKETPDLIGMFSGDRLFMEDDNGKELPDAIKTLQEGKYLAKLNTEILKTNIDAKTIPEGRLMDFLASNSDRNQLIIDQIKIANNLKELTLVFACSIDHVYALHILCQENNIDSEYIIGKVLQEDRLKMLERFKEKDFFILINLDLLSTGIDIPTVNRLILCRPIKSPILTSQILGRALRGKNNGGNELNTIINLKDNIKEYPGLSFLYNFFDQDWD